MGAPGRTVVRVGADGIASTARRGGEDKNAPIRVRRRR